MWRRIVEASWFFPESPLYSLFMEVTQSILDQWQDACVFFVSTFPVDQVLVLQSEEGERHKILCAAPADSKFDCGTMLSKKSEIADEAPSNHAVKEQPSPIDQEFEEIPELASYGGRTGFQTRFPLPILDPDGAHFGSLVLLSRSDTPFEGASVAYAEQLRTQIETGLALLKEKEYLRLAYETIRKSVEEINFLRKILPICAHCKKVRNDNGYWQQVENYFHQNAQMDFTHSICPDCMRELYPDIAEKILAQAKGKP
jgi:hypothetical protein